jgi:hypothetical protein
MSETNKLRNLAVALLHLMVNAPPYGAVDARPTRNPAPTQGLVGKKMLTLFNWPVFLGLLHINKPDNAPPEWFALNSEPNPFTKAPFILDNKARGTIADGIAQLQENCPSSATGDWVLKQFNSNEFSEFKTEWAAFCRKLARPLNTAVDNHLAENNLSLQQIVQEHEDGVELGAMVGPVLELRMKVASLEAIFGAEILGAGTVAADLDIPSWMNVSSNNLFNLFKNRWRRDHVRQVNLLKKATDETEDAMESEPLFTPLSPLDVTDALVEFTNHAEHEKWEEKDLPILRQINKTLTKTVKAARHFRNDVDLQDRLKKYQETIQPIYEGLTGKATSINVKFDGKRGFFIINHSALKIILIRNNIQGLLK